VPSPGAVSMLILPLQVDAKRFATRKPASYAGNWVTP